MKPIAQPLNEKSRLASLVEHDILDTAAEKIFDSITLLASQICNVPIAMIVFIDQDRQWFKSTHGIPEELKDVKETPRDIAFCAHTILSSNLFEVNDLKADERFKNNPFVTNFPNIRFYAGVPLAAEDGSNIGTLCVLDQKPSELNEQQRTALKNLSRIIISLMNARRNLTEVALLGQVLQNTASQIYLFDNALNCIYSNQWYLKNLLLEKINYFDFDLNKLFPEIPKRELQAVLAALFSKQKNIFVTELERTKTDASEIYLEVRIQVNFAKKNPILIVIVNDITNKKIAERLLQDKAQEKVETALEETRSKSQFLATMSHEIRTPLNGVIGMTTLLYETSLTEEQKDYVKIIHSSGEMLLSVINNVLDFSKIEAGQMKLDYEDFDLRNLLLDAIEIFAVKAYDKKITLWADIDPSTPSWVNGDYLRLQQVLNNLLGNAIKFTENGNICLKARLEKSDHNSTLVAIQVIDSGIGIPHASQKELFKSFSQGSPAITRQYGGTGLGLAITKQLVELMGGAISVKSEPSEGSQFSFSINFKKCLKTHTEYVPSWHFPHLNNVRILCIDASNVNVKNVQLPLLSCNVFCDIAENLSDANHKLKRAELDEKPYQAILIDAFMRDQTGFELIAQIRKIYDMNLPPIILMAPLGFPYSENIAKTLKIAALVKKPIRPEKLYKAISDVVLAKKSISNVIEVPNTSSISTVGVLVVDDDKICRELLLRILLRQGYQVDVATNGLEAVAMAQAKVYHMIFMDCEMDGMDGYEATKLIRSNEEERNQFTPIIAVTANSSKNEREKCLSYGMSDYIVKPVDISFLVSVMEKWLNNS